MEPEVKLTKLMLRETAGVLLAVLELNEGVPNEDLWFWIETDGINAKVRWGPWTVISSDDPEWDDWCAAGLEGFKEFLRKEVKVLVRTVVDSGIITDS